MSRVLLRRILGMVWFRRSKTVTRRLRQAEVAIRGAYDVGALDLQARRLLKIAAERNRTASIEVVPDLVDVAAVWAQALAARTYIPLSPGELQGTLRAILERIRGASVHELPHAARWAGAELGTRLRVTPAAFEDLLDVLIPWIEHHHGSRDEAGHPIRAKVLAALAAAYAQGVLERVTNEQVSLAETLAVIGQAGVHSRVGMDPLTFQSHMDTNKQPMLLLDRRGQVLDANQSATTLLALGEDTDGYLDDTAYTTADSDAVASIIDSLVPGVPFHVDYAVAWPEGTCKALIRLTLQWHPGSALGPGRICVIAEDVTRRKVWHQRIDHLVNRDEVTDLPVRRAFLTAAQTTLETSTRHPERTVGICVIRMLGLARITRELGPHHSDAVIKTLAARTTAALTGLPNALCSRLDPETLAIMIGDPPSWAASGDTVQRLIRWLSEPVHIGTHRFTITPRVGVAEATTAAITATELLTRAEHALDTTTPTSRKPWTTTHTTTSAQHTTSMIAALPDALATNQLTLTYSPIINITDATLAGLRVTVRWNHPHYGEIPADKIIGTADELGLDLPLARWVLDTATRQAAHWRRDRPHNPPFIQLVIPPRLADDDVILHATREALTNSGLPPHLLHLALPADAFLDHHTNTPHPHITALADMGTSLELRGYGTHFSAFDHLSTIQLHGVIMPTQLTTSLHNTPQHRATRTIAHALIAISEELGYELQLDGITTPDQIHDARFHGTCHAHGPLFGQPLPPEDITTMLHEQPDKHPHNWIATHNRVPAQRK